MLTAFAYCKGGGGGESDRREAAWGPAGGESGAARFVYTSLAKNATMQAFLLPTPHLLRLYHLLSFFAVLSGLLRCAVRMAGGAPRLESDCKSTIPPLDPPCTFAAILVLRHVVTKVSALRFFPPFCNHFINSCFSYADESCGRGCSCSAHRTRENKERGSSIPLFCATDYGMLARPDGATDLLCFVAHLRQRKIHLLATPTVLFFWLPQGITWLPHSRQARC